MPNDEESRTSARAEAERAAAIQASLDNARAAQKMEKERRLIEQAQQEKEEFDRILRVQREAAREVLHVGREGGARVAGGFERAGCADVYGSQMERKWPSVIDARCEPSSVESRILGTVCRRSISSRGRA
ncbi:MAG: hypothetical protein VXY90_13995, partial [Pseudomonadota bacterium]|nr:hypothetical protein [Pseudomonadota bacterium]